MLNRLLPRSLNDGYYGSQIGLWLFGVVLFIEGGIGLRSALQPRLVAMGADGLPLDKFDPAAAAAVVALFALVGLARLAIALMGVVTLARYRALVPLFYLQLLFFQVGSKLLLTLNPIARNDDVGSRSGSAIIWGLTALLVVGFALSLVGGRRKS
ncbi:hypothetical protein [Nitrospirillum iridis]|uniref:Uncharacterized protein n=1 Tax=Nitrospirillum iridis TaxID=765888 RepID=A0A7X0EBE2_9PROT|nr:hypothetical protein [Nitrospirillum iridis]MBB6250572.1 hypothetical protein [Nitrospirillum iridis]